MKKITNNLLIVLLADKFFKTLSEKKGLIMQKKVILSFLNAFLFLTLEYKSITEMLE